MKKPVMLDEQQIQRLLDLVYTELDSVATGSTVYGEKEEVIEEFRELLDILEDAQSNGA